MSATDETRSPKQLARRSLIIDAAVETLKREGIAGCTVRAIAAATPFTKGTIHYYFGDVNEIVNTAYLRLTDEYVAAVEEVAGQASRPLAAFWRAVRSYVEGFWGHPRMGLLWLEYSSWAVRNDYGHEVASSVEAIRAMFARHLEEIEAARPGSAGAVTRYLLGTVLELAVSPVEIGAVMGEVAGICGLRPPRVQQTGGRHEQVCPLCFAGR
ncbi:MAG TPA: TetR/AcrR family transcriptional regulator [Acidimicrobiia bacterium]|nr:TetR/AcrR family transcriptional regulator [Acidimicrobiia bacterium]